MCGGTAAQNERRKTMKKVLSLIMVLAMLTSSAALAFNQDGG